jgi:hypothetical protein
VLRGLCAFALLAAPPGKPDRKPSETRDAAAEARVLKALAGEDLTALAALARKLHVPDPTKRRDIGLHIKRDVVEFHFRGEFPGDKIVTEMLEYAVSNKDKDYETLLVAEADELERLQKLGEALGAWRRRGRAPALTVRLSWTDVGKKNVKGLDEILAREKPASRADFLRLLEFNKSGLGAFNLKAEPKALPKRRLPAEVVIGVRLPRPLPR